MKNTRDSCLHSVLLQCIFSVHNGWTSIRLSHHLVGLRKKRPSLIVSFILLFINRPWVVDRKGFVDCYRFRTMSSGDSLLERYRAARTRMNSLTEEQETLYHKRQRLVLEDTRTDAYNQTLARSKPQKRSKVARQENSRSSVQPVRLSAQVRLSFEAITHTKKEETKQPSSAPISSLTIVSLPVRIYPPTVQLRTVTSTHSMNIDLLHQTHLVGQFDRKFLVSKRVHRSSSGVQVQLILFDQHAISERILLEHLQTYFREENTRTLPFRLPAPVVIARNPRFLYTEDQITLLERTGFSVSSLSTRNLLVRAVPGWLLSLGQRHRRPSSVTATSLLDGVIRETIDHILAKLHSDPIETLKMNLNMIVYETLKSLACHNAIKFNDLLSMDECRHLLSELKLCAMPFICAHGRTSAALLWEYDRQAETYPVNITELEQQASIHKWLKES